MKQNILKILTIIAILILASGIASCFQICNADNIIDPNTVDPSALYSPDINKRAGNIISVIQVAGTVISVGALAVIGIKYMIGSAEEKAKYKETMVPYIIGCVILFSGTNLLNVFYKIVKDVVG